MIFMVPRQITDQSAGNSFDILSRHRKLLRGDEDSPHISAGP